MRLVRITVLGVLVISGCQTEYGNELRCSSDEECLEGRVCERIQGYCVLPASAPLVDGSVSADGELDLDSRGMDVSKPMDVSDSMIVDAAPMPVDAAPMPVDTAPMPTDGAPMPIDGAPIVDGEVGCGNGREDPGEECDTGGVSDICRGCGLLVERFSNDSFGREYVLVERKRLRPTAQTQCEAWGGTLVTLETPELVTWLVTELGERLERGEEREREVWVALQRNPASMDWEWGLENIPEADLPFCGGGVGDDDTCAVFRWRQECFLSRSQCGGNGTNYVYVCQRQATPR